MPDFKDEISRRLAGLGLSPTREWDIVEELNQHLEDRYTELEDEGVSADEARRIALEELQDDDVLAQQLRPIERPRHVEPAIPVAASGTGVFRMLIDEARADIRYGLRQLRSTPTFTIVAVLTLAIGIGANMAVFSQVNAVMLKRLPVRHPEELKQLEWTSAKRGFATRAGSDWFRTAARDTSEYFSYPAYRYLRDHARSFSDLVCFTYGAVNARVSGRAESVSVQLVSGNYFRTLGVDTILGRPMMPDDDRPGAEVSVAVVSHGFWQRAFGGDSSAIGQAVAVNGEPFIIIGVTPKSFNGVDPRFAPDLTLPMAKHATATARPDVLADRRDWFTCRVVGRLQPDLSEQQAMVESEALLHEFILEDPPAQEYVPPKLSLFDIKHGSDILRQQTSLSLSVLMSVVGVIVLIACANIASLLLARATARHHEIATRLAVGASRGRLVRQLLTESLLLSSIGGGLGIALAYALGRFLPSPLTSPLSAARPAPLGVDLTPDVRVLAFAAGLALVTGLVFGLAPARRATRVDLLSMMKSASSGAEGASRVRMTGKALIAVQVALSLLLLIGASLFIRTLLNLRSVPLGFDPDGVLVFQANPSLNGYRDERLLNFFEDALERLEKVPGVASASMSSPGVLSGAFSGAWVCVPDRQPADEEDTTWLHRSAPRLFETMQIPLLVGRDLDWRDRGQTQKVAIVNDAFGDKYYPGMNPIGKTFGLGTPECDPHELTVIGLVADTKYWTLRNPVSPTVYLPYRQQDINARAMTVALRARGDPTTLIPAVREAMRDLDPDVPIFQVRTELEQIDRGVQQERLLTNLLIVFGVIAWALASIGIYGTLSYAVTRRTSEIGLRMALGAARRDVIRLIVHESIVPVAVGIAVGLFAAFALTRWIESFLFGVSQHDPWTIASASAVILLTAAVAASLPATRASRIDPLQALRYE